MNIVYNKINGRIEGVLDNKINYKIYYSNFPQEFQDNIDCVKVENPSNDFLNYKVVDGEIKMRPKEEINEIEKYGEILTEEERLNILIIPSYEEIQQSHTTIEILSLLQEVIGI